MYPPNIAKRNCQASSSSLSKYTPIALIACCQSEQILWKNCIPNYIAMSHNHNDSELGANLATLVCNFSRSKALQFVRKLMLIIILEHLSVEVLSESICNKLAIENFIFCKKCAKIRQLWSHKSWMRWIFFSSYDFNFKTKFVLSYVLPTVECIYVYFMGVAETVEWCCCSRRIWMKRIHLRKAILKRK